METIEKRLGYTFRNRRLLTTALTHSSYVLGYGKKEEFNERLEFLGDAVLELCVSRALYEDGAGYSEGQMTRMRAALVCEKALYCAAEALSLQDDLLLGHGEERTGGRTKPSVLSDALEAVIGAIYLDGGMEAAETFIRTHVLSESPADPAVLLDKGPKTTLQEYVQSKHLGEIRYEVIRESGPDHLKIFTVSALLNGQEIGNGSGRSKQDAGSAAAREALGRLKSEQN